MVITLKGKDGANHFHLIVFFFALSDALSHTFSDVNFSSPFIDL
jgi:hypothetical protein